MPRHITTFRRRHPQHDAFVARLASEFTANGSNAQPLILEERLPESHSRRLHVIWDAWKDLSFEQRSEVIVDAYRRVEGEEAASEVTIATGATPEEAFSLGLLPYKVEPVRRKDDPHPADAYRRAMEEEAGRTLLGNLSHGLRYARLEDAEAACNRLEKALPRSSWAVVREEPVEC